MNRRGSLYVVTLVTLVILLMSVLFCIVLYSAVLPYLNEVHKEKDREKAGNKKVESIVGITNTSDLLSIATYELEFLEASHIEEKIETVEKEDLSFLPIYNGTGITLVPRYSENSKDVIAPERYLVTLQKGEKNIIMDDKKLYDYIQEENIKKGDIIKIELEEHKGDDNTVKYSVKNIIGKIEKQ